MHRLTRTQHLVYQLGLAAVALFVLVPIWGLAQMAFDGSIKGWPLEFRVWPKAFTLGVFQAVWERAGQSLSYLGLLQNSLIVSGGAAALSVALGASMAYAFARLRFPSQRAGHFGLLLGALLPPVALMTPLYILLTALHVRTSLLGLMIVYTAFAMPFCVWNMRAAFRAVPRELEESAFLDGASLFDTYRSVTLPLAAPAIAVAALLAFLSGYSEFAMAWLFVDRSDNVTLAMAISGMVGEFGASWNFLAALSLLMSAPVVVIFLVLQRYLLRGLWVGEAG